jgi:hypothetical protein
MAVDVPGTLDVELAGRPARVRTGIARLALETGSPILPIVTLRRGWGLLGTIGEPIDPAGFDDPTTLTRHLVAVQGRCSSATRSRFMRMRSTSGTTTSRGSPARKFGGEATVRIRLAEHNGTRRIQGLQVSRRSSPSSRAANHRRELEDAAERHLVV